MIPGLSMAGSTLAGGPTDLGSDSFGPVSGTGGSFGAGYINSSGQGVSRDAGNNGLIVVGIVVVVVVLLLRKGV